MAVYDTQYPESFVLDRRNATHGAAYWRGFKDCLENHFRWYHEVKPAGSLNTGYGLYQTTPLLGDTFVSSISEYQAGPSAPSVSMDKFCNPPTVACRFDGQVDMSLGSYVYMQLSFFIPTFIWEFTESKSTLVQSDLKIHKAKEMLRENESGSSGSLLPSAQEFVPLAVQTGLCSI